MSAAEDAARLRGWWHQWRDASDGFSSAVVTFNVRPARTLHASWIPHIADETVWQRLSAIPRTEPERSRHILAHFDLTDRLWTDFSEPTTRLALLDPTAFERLGLFLGLALRGAPVRHVVLGADRRRLIRDLGAEAVTFAVKRAPVFKVAVSGAARDAPEPMPSRPGFIAAGLRALDDLFGDAPYALKMRLRLKLPRNLGDPGQDESEPTDPNRQAKQRETAIRLAREVLPTWAPLFA